MGHRDVYGESANNSYACSSETLGLLMRLQELQRARSRLLVEMGQRIGKLEHACSGLGRRDRTPAMRKKLLRRIERAARQEGAPELVTLLSSEAHVDVEGVCKNRSLQPFAQEFGVEEGGRYYERSSLRIGLIADEFNVRYLSDAFDVILLNPDNYRDLLNSHALDLVLCMSSWRGAGYIGGVKIAEAAPFYGPAGRFLARTILAFARSCGVPTVFQSIEDPPSYKVFLDVARSADFIFTSCVEMVDRYKVDTGSSKVFVAKYGVNPVVHNPIGMFRSLRREELSASVMFAGAWYARFKGRCRDMSAIFDGVLETPSSRLTIIDRNLNSSERGDGRVFPYRYAKCIRPPVEYRALQRLHKLFVWTVNVNSVTDSATMCARRLYEVQALGCSILSNASRAVEVGFPAVFQVRRSGEVASILRGYTRRELMSMRIEGVRVLYSGCTVYDRMNEVLEIIGMPPPFRRKPVQVVCRVMSDSVWRFVGCQEYPCSVLEIGGESGTPHVSSAREAISGARQAAERIKKGYFICFDALEASREEWEDDPHYVEDLVNAFKFADCAYVRYGSEEESLDAYEFEPVSALNGPALFDAAVVGVTEVLGGEIHEGLRGFVIAHERWGRNTSSAEKHLGVVVPVFGNVDFFWKRCIRSLMRSSLFGNMRIYAVDCLSASEKEQLNRIAAAFDNVVVVPCGLDGKRSRADARATGVAAVEEPFFTLLDVEDEAAGDSFAHLLSVVTKSRAGVAVGIARKASASYRRLRRRQVVARLRRRIAERHSPEVRAALFSSERFAGLARVCLEDGACFDGVLARAAHLLRRPRSGEPAIYIGSKEVFDVSSKQL